MGGAAVTWRAVFLGWRLMLSAVAVAGLAYSDSPGASLLLLVACVFLVVDTMCVLVAARRRS